MAGSGDLLPRRFQTTRWSLVLEARSADAAEARAALAALCEVYWYPLYAFVRRKGYDADQAQDLVQGFFARLLERNDLATVDRSKGRLRSFLMAACSHYLANEADRERADKRGGGRQPISIDQLQAEGRYHREPADGLTPERLYERQWALALLDQVLARLAAEMERAGKASLYEALRPALLGAAERAPYAEIGRALGLSEEAARAAAKRLRHRYRELLREEVARTLADPEGVDVEIRGLFAALAG
jgi:RNA polymerase sigma-70 factor (ECF subfamily)